MSKMDELYQKVAGDAELQKKFFGILDETENLSAAGTEEKLTAFAKDAGFEISIGEMQKFFKDLIEGSQDQLSEVELDMVAGGKGGGIDWGKITAGVIVAGSVAGGVAGGGPGVGFGCVVAGGVVEGATR
jgi:predicted ribosomally synthesized peptide with nif11-like leader